MGGDCGVGTISSPFGRYSSFRYPNCTGYYHYQSGDCDYGCLIVEYLHHSSGSYSGEYSYQGRCKYKSEWELCDVDVTKSRQLLQSRAPDAYNMILDPFY